MKELTDDLKELNELGFEDTKKKYMKGMKILKTKMKGEQIRVLYDEVNGAIHCVYLLGVKGSGVFGSLKEFKESKYYDQNARNS